MRGVSAAQLQDAVALLRRAGTSMLFRRAIRLAYRRYVGLVDFPLRPRTSSTAVRWLQTRVRDPPQAPR